MLPPDQGRHYQGGRLRGPADVRPQRSDGSGGEVNEHPGRGPPAEQLCTPDPEPLAIAELGLHYIFQGQVQQAVAPISHGAIRSG